jgi:hypothetical protein
VQHKNKKIVVAAEAAKRREPWLKLKLKKVSWSWFLILKQNEDEIDGMDDK